MGFIRRGFIWDIPILIFAYVLFSGHISGFWVPGPSKVSPALTLDIRTPTEALDLEP